MSKSRMVRIILSAVVIVGALVILYPRFFAEIRSNGTINARVITVQAPISGTIARATMEVGDKVDEGDTLFRIEDDASSQGLIASLEIERGQLAARIDALDQRISDNENMRDALQMRVARYAEETIQNLILRREEAVARQKFWSAIVDERTKTLARQEKLLAGGSSTPVRVDEAKSLLLQAREESNRAKADVKRLSQEESAATSGVFVNDGQNDVPYSRQRLDEVVLSLSELTLQRAESAGRLKAIETQFKEESIRAGRRESAILRSPVEGIVWRRMVNPNTAVTKNNDLIKIVECSKLFAEVGISESTAEAITIGQSVTVRLQGSDRSFKARVVEIRGTRSVSPGLEYAAQPPLLKKDELLLVASWSDPDAYASPSNFCNVGRRAEITIRDGESEADGKN